MAFGLTLDGFTFMLPSTKGYSQRAGCYVPDQGGQNGLRHGEITNFPETQCFGQLSILTHGTPEFC